MKKSRFTELALSPLPRTAPPAAAIYSRAQMEWALWSLTVLPSQHRRKPSSVFRTRIKRLLEFDRTQGAQASRARWAFSDSAPGGSGEHSAFSALDGFALWVGLELLDLGLRRADITTALAGLRNKLHATLTGADTLGDGVFLFLPRLGKSARPRTNDSFREPEIVVGSNNAWDRLPDIMNKMISLEIGMAGLLLLALLPQAPQPRRLLTSE